MQLLSISGCTPASEPLHKSSAERDVSVKARQTGIFLSLPGLRLAERFALAERRVLLLLIETLMKTLAKKATWNRLQPAPPLMRKRCKIHKGFRFTRRRSRRALPCVCSRGWFHNSTSASPPFPPSEIYGTQRRATQIPRPDPARVQTLRGRGKKKYIKIIYIFFKRVEPPDFRKSHLNPSLRLEQGCRTGAGGCRLRAAPARLGNPPPGQGGLV